MRDEAEISMSRLNLVFLLQRKGKGSNTRYMKMKEMVKNMDLIGNHTEVNMTQRLNQVIIDLDFFIRPIVQASNSADADIFK